MASTLIWKFILLRKHSTGTRSGIMSNMLIRRERKQSSTKWAATSTVSPWRMIRLNGKSCIICACNKAKAYRRQEPLCTNPGRDRMVYAYKYTKIIKFMDMEAKTVRTLNFEQSEFDEKTLTVRDGLDANVTHYMQVLPTRDYVYVTHSGRSPYVVAAENTKGNNYMYLEKYDWNGNPVKRYKLHDFCVYNVIDPKSEHAGHDDLLP